MMRYSIISTELTTGFFVLLGGVRGLKDSMTGDVDLFSVAADR